MHLLSKAFLTAALIAGGKSRSTQIPLFPSDPSPHGRFLHITDIHLDPLYVQGADFEAGCHYKSSNSFSSNEIAGKYGSPVSGCDAPPSLVNLTLTTLARDFSSSIDFVIWTGDSVRHDSDPRNPRSMAEVKDLNAQVTKMMRQTFPDIPILPIIGNNDVHPHNELAFTPGSSNEMLDFFATLWSDFIPQNQLAGFKKNGNFYIDLIPGKLIGISFNTMYLFNSNPHAGKCGGSSALATAGDVSLAWLNDTLSMARRKRFYVYITGHVPPNTSNFIDSCYYAFAKVVQEFRDVVLGQFYGHMNIDHFFFPLVHEYPMFTNDSGDAYSVISKYNKGDRRLPSWVSTYFQNLLGHYKYASKKLERKLTPILVAPSVVPAFNPGFRIFQYQQHSLTAPHPIGSLLNYDQYFLDLEKWNEDVQKGFISVDVAPSFVLEYQPLLAYNLTQDSITPSTWMDLSWKLTHKIKKGKNSKHKKKKKHRLKEPFKKRPSFPGLDKSDEEYRVDERELLLKTFLRNMVVSVKEFEQVGDFLDL